MQNIIKQILYIWKIDKRNSIKNLYNNYIKPMKNLTKCIFTLYIKLKMLNPLARGQKNKIFK